MALPRFPIDSPVTLNLRPICSAPLSDRESLNIFGTVAFGSDFVAGTVGVERNSIEAGMWFAFVPAVYRDDIVRGVEVVFREFEGEQIRPGVVERFGAAISAWVRENVMPR